MGRARVISGGTDGYYTVELITDTGGVEARLSEIAARLAEITAVIDQAATSVEKSRLRLEQIRLTKQQSALAAALTADQRDVWCADFTEDLAAGTEVGTIEINGDADQILLTPAGDTATALGKLQHPVASTPAGVAVNMALMPCWQRWKPTYRIGEILAIDTETDTCDVGIEAQYSRYQGLPINQAGETWEADKAAAVSGWAAFCAAHPDWDLVTETGSTQIAYTPALAAELEEVNAWVNSHHHYTLDEQQYGKLEHWTIMAEGGAGDCEDYALTKAQMLLARGYPASALHIEVGRTTSGEGHAWLVVQTDAGDIALDLNYSRPMRTWELPYGERMRQTGASWAMAGVKLTGVPVEYMDGLNADVFEPSDRVVVQFVAQDWMRPVVIGFEDHPRGFFEEFSARRSQDPENYGFRYKNKKWSGLVSPMIMKITDRYYHDRDQNIYDRATCTLQARATQFLPYDWLDWIGDFSYQGDHEDIHVYELGEMVTDWNYRLYIDGNNTGMSFACVRYERDRLWGVVAEGGYFDKCEGVKAYEMSRAGDILAIYDISSHVQIERRRDHLVYDSKNDFFYLIGNSRGWGYFDYDNGCDYSSYGIVIEKYTPDWRIVYRRVFGGWCVSSVFSTLWQGDGWYVGDDFMDGLQNVDVRYPTDHNFTDVYDDKLFVWRYQRNGETFSADALMTLDLTEDHPRIPFSSDLDYFSSAPPGVEDALITGLNHHGTRKAYND
jgi:predicted transglutaminase-like cysteine proteinase